MPPTTRPLIRHHLRAGILLLLAAASCSPDEDPGDARPPDIILYLVDTLRADHLGLYGYQRNTSPNLDRLAEESVVFRQAYATSSWTKASTASMLTGLDPLDHGARSRRHRISEEVTLLPEVLRAQGYHTVGVVTNANVIEHWGFVQGYDEFRDIPAEQKGVKNRFEVRAKLVHQKVFEILDRRPADKPLFLYIHTIDAHGPNKAPAPYHRRFTDRPGPPGVPNKLRPRDRGKALQNVIDHYDGEIAYLDDRFGEFLQGLKDRELYNSSLLWFISDHGEEHLDHGRGGHGNQLFNEAVRIPMILKMPEQAHAGQSFDTPVQIIDVMPTVLCAVGVKDVPTEGVELLSLLDGAEPAARPLFFDLNLNVGEQMDLFVQRGVLVGNHKYIEEILPRSRQLLYDLSVDPGEKTNLIETRADLAQELAGILHEHRSRFRSGLTLRFAGETVGGADRMTVVLTTTGRFTEAAGVELEPEDDIRREDAGQRIELNFVLEDTVDIISRKTLQDVDTVCVQVDPPEAPIRVESIRTRGTQSPAPLFLGEGSTKGSVPSDLSTLDPRLLVDSIDAVFPHGMAQRIPYGVYAAFLPTPNIIDLDSMPEDLRQRLIELGYLEG